MSATYRADSKTVVMPLPRTAGSLDADARRLGPAARPPVAAHATMALYDTLALPRIVRDPDGQFRPDFSDMVGFLAERFEPNGDSTEWTIHLRKARSHFGNELAAEDVKWSWERCYALRGVGLWRARVVGGLPSADGVVVVDERTVVFNLPAPRPTFPRYWASETNVIFDSREARKHVTEADPWASEFLAVTPCGYGPMSVERHDERELVLAARDDYWGGRPGIDRLIYTAVATREEALGGFERGDFNLIGGLTAAEFRRIAALPDVEPVVAKAGQAQIDFDWRIPPLDDLRVRQAISMAIPYDRVIAEAYDGLARPGRGPVFDIAPDSDIGPWPYATDVERARALLHEANAEGAEVELAVGPDPESAAIAKLVVEALESIGLTVRRIDRASLAPDRMVGMLLLADTPHALADPHYNIAHEYDPPRGNNRRHIKADAWVQRLAEINAMEDPAVKPNAYRQLAREIVEFAPKVFLANSAFLMAHRKEIDPWLTSGKFSGYHNLFWAFGRAQLPQRAS